MEVCDKDPARAAIQIFLFADVEKQPVIDKYSRMLDVAWSGGLNIAPCSKNLQAHVYATSLVDAKPAYSLDTVHVSVAVQLPWYLNGRTFWWFACTDGPQGTFMQIQKILVPIDFSPPSRLALNHGIAFARKFRARVTLLHIVESHSAVDLIFPAETAAIEKDHRDQAQRMLSMLIEPRHQVDLDLHSLVKSGNVEEHILSTIDEEGIELVVMGTHGRGLVGRSLIGSVTQNVLARVQIPTLTVCRVNRFPRFDRILFATDLSELSNEGSRFTIGLAQTTHANVIALHAVEVGVEGGAEAAVYLSEGRLEEARTKMDEMKAEASRQTVNFDAVLTEGVAADAISKTANEQSADFIVITIRKSGLVEQTRVSSTAERVIREAHVPVLAIPVGDKASAKQIEEPHAA
jgi:nucleotide-binding universal stress UspA family protein